MQGSREFEKVRKGQRQKWQEGGWEEEKNREKHKTKTNRPKRGNESDKDLE